MSSLKRLVLCFACAFTVLPAFALPARPADTDPTEAALIKLEQASVASDRARAALSIATRPDRVSASTVSAMKAALYVEPDPMVRAAISSSFGEIANKQEKGVQPGPLEPAMVQALSSAYEKETDPRVRCAIASAAGQMNHSSAEKLLTKALADPHSQVRLVAHKAKLKRDQRLTTLVTG